MSAVLFKALGFILMISLGYFTKTIHLLEKKDSQVLMKIIINITMPCALLAGFRDFSANSSLLFAAAIGFGFNFILLAAGWICSMRQDGYTRALYILNVPTYNIGNFVLPFVQGFLPAQAVPCLCMFDLGNNPYGAGAAYSAASSVSGGDGRLSIRDILRKLFHSPPFLAYFFMMLLYILGIHLPDAFFDMCSQFGQGNTFLAMFTLGLIFEWHLTREDVGAVARILGLRYGLCIAAVAVIFFLTPLDLVTRQTLCLCLVGPITTLSIPFGISCGCDQSRIAAISSTSMLLSFILSLELLVLWA